MTDDTLKHLFTLRLYGCNWPVYSSAALGDDVGGLTEHPNGGTLAPRIVISEFMLRIPDHAGTVLLHEILHAMKPDWDETLVSKMEIALFPALNDNSLWRNPFHVPEKE